MWLGRSSRGSQCSLERPSSGFLGYLSLAIIYAGISILRNALWAILLSPLLVLLTQRELIEREERYLERTFGEEYLAYRRRVRRWV